MPASFVTETSLPFAIAGAVKFDNQAQFHARKYLLHLAKLINGNGNYQKLEAYARSRFRVEQFEYRWSTQDMVSFDRLPYIGKLTPFNKHVYVATGFSLWGMSKGTLAGMLLSDLILGVDNPWLKLYDSTRATPFLTTESLKNNLGVGFHWVGDRLKGLENSSVTNVARGEAKLLTINGNKVAAYRNEQGELHAVSATCTHLGCIVNWNSAEKSWDCPCHGGRYSYDGKVLHGPPVKDLERYKV